MISYGNNERNAPVRQVNLCWSGNKKPSCAKVAPSACCAPRGYEHGTTLWPRESGIDVSRSQRRLYMLPMTV